MASKRRRKAGPRHKNGHLKRMPITPSPREIAASMPHRRGLGDAAVAAGAENELGRMLLRGELETEQATAGELYERLWRGYVATLQGPGFPGRRQGVPACRNCEPGADQCLCALRKRIYLDADKALLATGVIVAALVQNTAILDRQCPHGGLSTLKVGLGALAQHFGLTTRRKSAYR
jgi:hypothetical protein